MPMIQLLEPRRLLAFAGSLDPTFDGDGRGVVRFGNRSLDTVYASALQPDGKIVIAGSTDSKSGNGTDIAVARLNPDSTLDTTFGITLDGGIGGGLFEIPLESLDDSAYGVTLMPDGRILIAGAVADDSSDTFVSLAIVLRLTPDGLPDTTFGGSGGEEGQGFIFVNLSKTPGGGSGSSEARGIALQSDGEILICGAADFNADTGAANFAVTRLFQDGSVDTRFGEFGSGTEVDGLPGVFTEAYGIAVYPDQSTVITGTAIQPATGTSPTVGIFVTAKLTRDGLPDTSFGDGGSTFTIFPPLDGETVVPVSTTLAIQPDGKILSAGLVDHSDATTGEEVTAFGIARYNFDGSPDPTFGGGTGFVETFFHAPDGTFADVGANQIVLQGTGRFFVVGRASLGSASGVFSSVAVARYLPTGALDSSFNRTGQLLLSNPAVTAQSVPLNEDFNTFSSASAAQLQVVPGGGILLLASQGNTLHVVRLVADGPDLVAGLTGIKPGSFVGGAKATAKLMLSNQGTVPSAVTVPVTLRLSLDMTYSPDDIFVVTLPAKGAVKPGTSKSLSLSFAYPGSGANGTYFLVADVNEARGAIEGNFLNNAATAPITIVVAPAFVEVSTALTGSPASALHGKKGAFSFQLLNTGNVIGKGSVLLQLLASSDGSVSDDDARLLPAKALKVSLVPGKVLKLKVTGSLPLVPGSYRLIVIFDGRGAGSRIPPGTLVTALSLVVT